MASESDAKVLDAEVSALSVLGEWNCVEKKWHGKHSVEFVVDNAGGIPLGAKVRLTIEPSGQQALDV